VALSLAFAGSGRARRTASVSGSLTVWDTGDRQAEDVGQAVVWLEGGAPDSLAPDTSTVLTEQKEFRPRVTVLPVGSVVAFPNNDPFNHNVFSLSPERQFDLGLYGRGKSKSIDFPSAGLVRVYCNVHATMSAFVVVVPTAFHARPAADGSFRLDGVPAGRYTLKAWHERSETVAERPLVIGARGMDDVRIELDARQFKPEQHLNKFGKPYRTAGRRY
jgi:plastocyanin